MGCVEDIAHDTRPDSAKEEPDCQDPRVVRALDTLPGAPVVARGAGRAPEHGRLAGVAEGALVVASAGELGLTGQQVVAHRAVHAFRHARVLGVVQVVPAGDGPWFRLPAVARATAWAFHAQFAGPAVEPGLAHRVERAVGIQHAVLARDGDGQVLDADGGAWHVALEDALAQLPHANGIVARHATHEDLHHTLLGRPRRHVGDVSEVPTGDADAHALGVGFVGQRVHGHRRVVVEQRSGAEGHDVTTFDHLHHHRHVTADATGRGERHDRVRVRHDVTWALTLLSGAGFGASGRADDGTKPHLDGLQRCVRWRPKVGAVQLNHGAAIRWAVRGCQSHHEWRVVRELSWHRRCQAPCQHGDGPRTQARRHHERHGSVCVARSWHDGNAARRGCHVAGLTTGHGAGVAAVGSGDRRIRARRRQHDAHARVDVTCWCRRHAAASEGDGVATSGSACQHIPGGNGNETTGMGDVH